MSTAVAPAAWPNLHDPLSLYATGLTGTIVSCWIAVPFGLLCQVTMHELARRDAA